MATHFAILDPDGQLMGTTAAGKLVINPFLSSKKSILNGLSGTSAPLHHHAVDLVVQAGVAVRKWPDEIVLIARTSHHRVAVDAERGVPNDGPVAPAPYDATNGVGYSNTFRFSDTGSTRPSDVEIRSFLVRDCRTGRIGGCVSFLIGAQGCPSR
jgi:hypothetical protein